MKCRKCQAFLLDLSDGALPEKVARRVKDHLSSCAHCRKTLENIHHAASVLSSMRRSSPPQDLWEKVEAAIEKHTPDVIPLLPLRRIAMEIGAVAAAVFLFAFLLFFSSPSESHHLAKVEIVEIENGFGEELGLLIGQHSETGSADAVANAFDMDLLLSSGDEPGD